MKDYFSDKPTLYKKYRPSYPSSVIQSILGHVVCRDTAWDCGTGNGQLAHAISTFFNQVFATDISDAQLAQCSAKNNIVYSKQAAESTHFRDDFFNLITVGQAIHWFNFEHFYGEVKRTAKHKSVIAILGYGRLRIDATIDRIIHTLYVDVLGKYWDKERKYVDENYLSIPFPFQEITIPAYHNSYQWDIEHILGYLSTWSAVKHYIQANNSNPIDLIREEITKQWGETKTVQFPILARVGIILK